MVFAMGIMIRFILYSWYTFSFSVRIMGSCNDLFSRFEQQTSILEKLAETMDSTTDRHGHDGPSQGLVSKHLEKTENWVLKSTL